MGVSSDKEPYFDKASNTGWTHFFNAAKFSLKGLREAFRRESAFRQELAILVILIPLGIWISQSVLDFVILMAVSGMVLVVELLNSAIEAAVDRAGTERHELAGLAKDYGSAAVMMSLAVSGMVWLTFLLQRIGIV
jgi:diacylglycerol kinase (ATP)